MFINERTAPVLSKYKENIIIELSKDRNTEDLIYKYLITICDKNTKEVLDILPVTTEEMKIAWAYYKKQQELKLKRQQQALKDMKILEENQKVADRVSAKFSYVD